MSSDLLRRGFEEIIPDDEFEERMEGGARIKFGADPTGSELHLGHAVIFNKLRQFQDAGHTVVFIIGDFTAQIGDPSGRDETRPMLSEKEVREHAETYRDQAFDILDEQKTEVHWNSDWYDDFGADDLIKLSQEMTVARMLERDDFSIRFENNQSIRLHEFLYPLIQGYDSVEVKADMELGGTDQKFNLMVGRQLQKREGQDPQLVGTLPLLVGTDGTKKMSKSYGNHIPLQSSPEDMFGKLMAVPDNLTRDYVTLLTDKPADSFAGSGDGESAKAEKKNMAFAVTARFKGTDAAEEAQDYFERTVEGDEDPENDEMDSVVIDEDEIWIVDLLDESGMVESRSEAKRLLKQGGVYLDGDRLEGFDHDIPMDEEHTLKVGKHRFRRVVPE
jgi:tyrosyl-tRNA synthetase